LDLTFADEQDGERRRKAALSPDSHTEETKTRNKRPSTPEVGHALRAAYQQTINEDIPPDLLDLLGKLG
jgi:hypothetical protein